MSALCVQGVWLIRAWQQSRNGMQCRLQAAFVMPKKLLTEAARYFVQAPRASNSAAPGASLLDQIDQSCRKSVQLPRQFRDRPEFVFLT